MQSDDLAAKLGARIALIRKQAGLGQKELAGIVGTAVAVISRVERGRAIPSVERLAQIAHALDIELGDLFTFDQEDEKHEEAFKRRRALRRLNAMLRQRQSRDIQSVLVIVERVFDISRRRSPLERKVDLRRQAEVDERLPTSDSKSRSAKGKPRKPRGPRGKKRP